VAPSQEETGKTQEALENLDKSYKELKVRVAKVEEELAARDQLSHSTSEDVRKIIREDALQVKNDVMSEMTAFKDEYKITEEKLEAIKNQISSMQTVPDGKTQALSHVMQSQEEIDCQATKAAKAMMSQEKKFQENLLTAKRCLEDIEECIAASAGDEVDMSDEAQREDKGAHLQESHLQGSQYTPGEVSLSNMIDDLKNEMRAVKRAVKIDGTPLINGDRQKQVLKAIDRLDKVDDDSSTLLAQLRDFRENMDHLLKSHPRVPGTKDLDFGATAYATCQKLGQSLKDDFKGHAENGKEQCEKYNMPSDLCILMVIDRLIEDSTSLSENAKKTTNIYRMEQQSGETLDSFMKRLLRENRQLSNNKQLVGDSFFDVLVAGINNANLLFQVSKIKSQIRIDEEAQRIVDRIKKEVFTQGTESATAGSTGIMQKHVHMQSSHIEQQHRPSAEFHRTEVVTNDEQFKLPFQDYDEDDGEDEEACIHQMQTLGPGRGLPPPNNQRYNEWFRGIVDTMVGYGGNLHKSMSMEDVRGRYQDGLCLACGSEGHSIPRCQDYSAAKQARQENDESFRSRMANGDYRGRSVSPRPRGRDRVAGRYSPNPTMSTSRQYRAVDRRLQGQGRSQQPGYGQRSQDQRAF